MKTPGEMLREAREAMGLSLKDVAAMTRIPRPMLGHLERDRYDEYSADVFARGHIRNYARELKLDPETVLQAFDRHTGRHRPTEGVEASTETDETPSKETPLREWQARWEDLAGGVRASHMVAIALVLIALFVVASVLTGSRATAQDPAEFPETNAEKNWELEKESEKTRWLLEQPADGEKKTRSE